MWTGWAVPLLLATGAAVPFVPVRPLVVGAAAVAVGAVILRLAGIRIAALGIFLCLIPPGVVGESSSRITLAVLLMSVALVVTTAAERVPDVTLVALLGVVGAAFLVVGHTAQRHSFTPIAFIYFAIAVLVWQMSQRPELSRRALRFVAMLAVAECASYWVSYLIGFRGGPHIYWLKTRHLDIYPPFTLTAGSGGFWGGHPRLIMFSGEAGLGAVVLLVALAYVLKHERGRRRTLLAALLISGVAAGQSSGAVLGLGVLAAVAVAAHITRRLTLLPAGVAAGTALVGLSHVATGLVNAKLTENASSLSDRGLLVSGNFAGDISLHATLIHHAAVALPVIGLLGYLAARTFRDPVGLGLVGAIAVIAWYAQPLQDHPGVLLLLLLLLTGRDSLTTTAMPAAPAQELFPLRDTSPPAPR